jgi:hypothetical protein
VTSRASRDLGLRRISISTRYLAAGSLLAGGVLSVAVAKALPGKASHPRTTGTGTVAPSQSATTISGAGSQVTQPASPSTTAPVPSLTAPAQAPQQAYGGSPMVSSGGS